MARKRKIPARKHHGIRDPLKQQEVKEKKLRNVVNSPPEKGNDQKASFNFTQFKKLADSAKAGKKVKRLHSGQEDKPTKLKTKSKQQKKNGSETTVSRTRSIKQFVDEEDVDYLRRVNRITTESLREAQYEAKYGVNVVRDPKTGMILIKKRPINEIDELIKQKQKSGIKGGKRGKNSNAVSSKPIDPKVAKQLIKQAIKEDNEEKIQENSVGLEEFKRDVFRFGEIVHAPPTLLTIPRKAQKSETVPRPGKKNNLLLKSMLNDATVSKKATKAPVIDSKINSKKKKGSGVTKAQLKGKRKDLPVATRNMLENEQNKIIELYRKLKKSKSTSTAL